MKKKGWRTVAVLLALDIEVPFVHFAEVQSARAAGAASREQR